MLSYRTTTAITQVSCINHHTRLRTEDFVGESVRKGKEAYLYSAFYILCISQSALSMLPLWRVT